jgi:hypothetical protein
MARYVEKTAAEDCDSLLDLHMRGVLARGYGVLGLNKQMLKTA